jgi:hypothetical protein
MIKKRLLEPALLIILTLAYYKLPWSELRGPAGIWGTLFLIGYLLLLPGNMLRKALNARERNPVIRAVLSIMYGLFFFLFVSFLWTFTRADLAWLRLNLPGWIFLLYLVTRMRKSGVSGTHAPSKSDLVSASVLLVVCLTIFILVFIIGFPVGHTSETLGHIAYVNEVQATGEAFPVSAFHAEAGEDGRDIRKGLLHVFYGFTGDYLSIGGPICVRIWNTFFIVILIGAVYGTAFLLFGNPWIALVSSVFFVAGGIGGSGAATLREAFLPIRFGYAYYLFLVAFVARYLKEREWRDLFACGCFAFAASATHIFFAVLSCFGAAIVVVWKVCFPGASLREHLNDGLLCAGAVATGALPYALFRYLSSYGAPNELHDQIQGMVYIGRDMFVANPATLLSWFGFLGIMTFFSIPALWRHRKDHVGLGYLMAAGFTVPLVMLNPILLPRLHTVLRYLVFHLPLLFPFHMLAAYFVVRSFGKAGEDGKRNAVARIFCIGLLLAAALDLLPLIQRSPLSPGTLSEQKQNSHLQWEDGLTYLRDRVPEGTVIVSDPLTSNSIAAFTPHYVTCMYGMQGAPGDDRALERIRMTREILTPFSPVSTSIALMEEMDADYIVLNNRLGSKAPLYYWTMQPDAYFPVRDKFIAYKKLFRPRFHRDGFLVLEWTGATSGDVEIGANPYYLQQIPVGFSHVGLEAGEATLEAYYLDSMIAGRGTELEMSFVWSGTQAYDMRNYIVKVRFDGERSHFCVSHQILGGFLSPDVWPANTYVLDPARILIPFDAVPGRYAISVAFLVTTEKPNVHIRDILFDNNNCRGIPIDAVAIE